MSTDDGVAGVVVTITRKRRPHLRNLRVQLRMLLDSYQRLSRCRGDVARRRFDAQVEKVLVVHQQEEFSTANGRESTRMKKAKAGVKS